MADTNHRRPAQSAHSSNSVNYGHFGTASYVSETRSWSFLRRDFPREHLLSDRSATESPFKLIKRPTKVIDPAGGLDPLRENAQKIVANTWLKALPETVPATEQHQGDTSTHHSSGSELNLLAFGSALILGSDDVQSGMQTAPVIAHVSPVEPSKLVLTLLGHESVSVELDKHYQVRVPCVSRAESASWLSRNGRILQLCFASRSSKQEATWLAIRQTTATTVFQPLLHRTLAVSADKSCLDISILVEIPVTRSGGLQHAHVLFHPEDSCQIAIVDIGGNWSIWRIHGRRSRSARILYRARLATTGVLVSQPDLVQQYDGWHKMLWLRGSAGLVDRLLVANRRSIELFDADGVSVSGIDVKIGVKGEEWNLDLLSGTARGEYFVLTSYHIFSMTVISPRKSEPKSRDAAAIRTLAYWSHFRSQDDDSLFLDTLRWTDVTWLFLSSNISGLTTAYRQSRDGHENVKLHGVPTSTVLEPHVVDREGLRLLKIQAVVVESNAVQKADKGLCVFKAYSQRHDSSIYEASYQVFDRDTVAATPANAIPVPKKQTLQHKSAHRIAERMIDYMVDNFIAEDDDDQGDTEKTTAEFLTSQVSSMTLGTTDASRCSRTCDLREIYDQLAARLSRTKMEEEDEFEHVLEAVGDAVDSLSTARSLSQIVSSLTDSNLYLAEIEDDSHRLNEWLHECEEKGDRIEYGPLLSSSSTSEEKSLIDVYNDLIDLWMSPLPSTLPDRSRVQRERLLRQVALQLYLSSIVVNPRVGGHAPESGQSEQNSNATASFVPSGWGQTGEVPPASSTLMSSQAIVEADVHVSTLKRYVSFKQPGDNAKGKSTTIGDILAHLPTSSDADPKEYSYNDVELNLAIASNDLKMQDLDVKSRRKAEKLARARQKQFEKQALAKKVAFEQSASLPSIMSSQLPVRGVQSSQAAPPNSSQHSMDNVPQLSMTQPERGTYGKRDATKAKAKGRSSRQKGF